MLAQLARREIQRFSALKSGISLVRNPDNLKEVINLSDRLLEMVGPEEIQKFSEDLCTHPQAISAIEKRLRVNSCDTRRLKKCSKGSLGDAYIKHLNKNGIKPESLTPPPVKDDFSYVVAHLYETHDIWHAVTGFSTRIEDELGLAAFGAAQLPSPFEYLILAGGILNTIFYQFDERDKRLDAITQGWTMGKRAMPFFGVDWNRLWDVSLITIKKEMKVTRQ